jgi:glycosyltransferase involved in cell wall biosynthesis
MVEGKMRALVISVVMPVYNGAEFLREAVNSILAQTFTNFEFIIVDDGSTDATPDLLRLFKDSRITIITHTKNLGIVQSLNDGIRAAKGEYLARMDADDISAPHRFQTQLNFLNQNRDCAAVGTFLRITTPAGKLLFTIEPPTRDLSIKKFLLHDSCLAHGSVMMRREMVLKVGMYSDDKRVQHAEDYDLFVHLASRYQLANLPEYLYTRKEHMDSISHQNYQKQQASAKYISQRAKKLISLTHLPKFSILMPNYNKGEFIGEAIESVLAQTFTDWELVIVDDASTDDSEEIIQKYLRDPRIVYLKNPANLGKAKTRNILVKESVAEIFGELDSDDTLSPDALQTMSRAHQKYPRAGFIYSQFTYCDQELHPMHIGFCRAGKRGETNLHHQYASAFRTYKRKFVIKTSGFDVYMTGAEDIDFIYKIEEVASLHFIDKPLYFYRNVYSNNNEHRADLIMGIYSHMKAKYFAYNRRKNKNLLNITFTTLIRQELNFLYDIARIKYLKVYQ